MDTIPTKKAAHPWVRFLIELLSVRAGVYVKQQQKDDERA